MIDDYFSEIIPFAEHIFKDKPGKITLIMEIACLPERRRRHSRGKIIWNNVGYCASPENHISNEEKSRRVRLTRERKSSSPSKFSRIYGLRGVSPVVTTSFRFLTAKVPVHAERETLRRSDILIFPVTANLYGLRLSFFPGLGPSPTDNVVFF